MAQEVKAVINHFTVVVAFIAIDVHRDFFAFVTVLGSLRKCSARMPLQQCLLCGPFGPDPVFILKFVLLLPFELYCLGVYPFYCYQLVL